MSEVKRVLYHHRTQGKAVEGVHIRGVTDALRAKGIHVDVMSLPGADPYSTPAAMAAKRRDRPLLRFLARLPEPLFEIAEIAYNLVVGWRIAAYVLRHPDTAFIYERYSLFMFMTVVMARLRGVPVILEVNDSAVVERVRPVYFGRLARWMERRVFQNADGLVFVSTRFMELIRRELRITAPAIVTPNAANIADFSFTTAERDRTRAQYGFAPDDVVCGYLGAFVHWHSIDEFVYRVADDLEANPQLKMLLVGDGARYAEVAAFVAERRLTERVVLAGRVPHGEVAGLLAAMDMAVMPNAGHYTSPVKLFEFMACGIPAVAPDLDPVREVLEDGRTGWLFKAHDIGAAASLVTALAREPARLAEVGARARAYISKHRQWRNNVEQLLDFQATLSRPRPLRPAQET